MQKIIKDLFFASIVLILLDAAFLFANKRHFENQVVLVQRVILQVNLIGAIVTYLLLIGGLYTLIIQKRRSVGEAFILGIIVYGVYEGTNYSIFKKWDRNMAIIDTLWGGVMFATTTYMTYYLSR